MADARRFILRSSEIEEREQPFSHPWNPKSQLIGVRLSRTLGLKRAAVNIARMPPGKESFVYHSHHHEEEWLYILSGRVAVACGIKRLDGAEGPYSKTFAILIRAMLAAESKQSRAGIASVARVFAAVGHDKAASMVCPALGRTGLRSC
jgi:cupin domain